MKFRQIQTAIAQGAAFQPPPEAVTTIVAAQETWPATLNAIGTMAAVQGVTVSADLSGHRRSDRVRFGPGGSRGRRARRSSTRGRSGRSWPPSKPQRELARLNFDRMQGLLNERVISQAEFDRATAEQKQTEARVGEIRATIDRKTIRAPFSGILGIRQVNLGQYLAGGDAIVSLQSLNPDLRELRRATAGGRTGARRPHACASRPTAWPASSSTGRVTAIDSIVDEATRNVQVQATLANPDGKLRPGMFVQTEVTLGPSRSVVALPGVGDQLRAVRRFGLRRHRPEGSERPDLPRRAPAVRQARRRARRSGRGRLRRQAGDEVVTSGVFKLRNGAAVHVNNKVQPGNNPAPKPEDS